MNKLRKLNPLSPSPRGDEQIDWSKQEANELKQKVRSMASRTYGQQESPRILLIGETGSGKSSFISSIMSTLSNEIIYASTIGVQEGREENTSKRYLEHRVFFAGEDEPLNFILCDSRGIAKRNQEGVGDRDIHRLMDGKLRHHDLIESERSSDGVPIDSREPKPPTYVVFVQKAQHLGMVDQDVQEKLHTAMEIVKSRGILSCVILTHIDLVKPSLAKNLRHALGSMKIQECVHRAAKEVGVNPNRVFVVKNYKEERRTHAHNDILILKALHGMLLDVYTFQRDSGARDLPTRPKSFPQYAAKHLSSSQPAYRDRYSTSYSQVPSADSRASISDDADGISLEKHSLRDDEDLGASASHGKSPPQSLLQTTVNTLNKNPFPRTYRKAANLRGARPLFQPSVWQLNNTSNTTRQSNRRLALQLPKDFCGEDDLHSRMCTTLVEWSQSDVGSLWMSYTLPGDLNLPLDRLPPESVDIQGLFLAPGHPIFLLTVFSPKNVLENESDIYWEQTQQMMKDEAAQVQLYTMHVVKLLTIALLNYCSCDFIIFPCIIHQSNLNLQMLDKELEHQKEIALMSYEGPRELTESTYRALKEAAITMVGATQLPYLMQSSDKNMDNSEELQLVVMDPDWRGVVSLLMENLTSCDNQTITYPKTARLKVLVAALEAAKRLSFVEDVLILTEDKRVQQCCIHLKEKIFKDTGVLLKLFVSSPHDQTVVDDGRRGNYIILLDCPPWVQLNREAVILRISESQLMVKDWV